MLWETNTTIIDRKSTLSDMCSINQIVHSQFCITSFPRIVEDKETDFATSECMM